MPLRAIRRGDEGEDAEAPKTHQEPSSAHVQNRAGELHLIPADEPREWSDDRWCLPEWDRHGRVRSQHAERQDTINPQLTADLAGLDAFNQNRDVRNGAKQGHCSAVCRCRVQCFLALLRIFGWGVGFLDPCRQRLPYGSAICKLDQHVGMTPIGCAPADRILAA